MKKKDVTHNDKNLGLSSIATLLSGWVKRISEKDVIDEMNIVKNTLIEKQEERNQASDFSKEKKK